MEEFQLVDVRVVYGSEDGRSKVRLLGRRADGEKVCVDVEPGPDCWYVLTDRFDEETDGELLAKKWPPFTSSGCHCPRCGGGTDTREPCRELQVADDRVGPVHRVTTVRAKSLYGYQTQRQIFYKLHLQEPYLMSKVDYWLKNRQLYEVVDPVVRFMADNGLAGGDWVNADPSSVKRVEKDENAPLVVCTFDIETVGHTTRSGLDPTKAEVVQVGCHVFDLCGQSGERSVLFMVGSCASTKDTDMDRVDVRCFEDEKSMLCELFAFWSDLWPDVLSGYNSDAFDMPFVLKRAEILDLSPLTLGGAAVTYTEKMSGSNQSGDRKSYTYNAHGTVMFDVLTHIVKSEKLRSYKLDDACKELLGGEGDKKDDVHYTEIKPLHEGSPADRLRLAHYCMVDVWLVSRLIQKRKLLINLLELARVLGCTVYSTAARGQSYRLQCKILHTLCAASPREHYMESLNTIETNGVKHTKVPFYEKLDKRVSLKFQGAIVLEPVKGWHQSPVLVLDFRSLYPSIMLAYNMCHTTLLSSTDPDRIRAMGLDPEKDVYISPKGYAFVQKHVREGVLPALLQDLLASRKAAKAQMKQAVDDFSKALYDGKQLALKGTCNSMYGILGAAVGSLQCIPIADSVTATGRVQIYSTKAECEKEGFSVVYGDTDSVFVKCANDCTVEEAFALGEKLERQINEAGIFKAPNYLEFEKVMSRLVLFEKKKYAACKFEGSPKNGKLNVMGLECARRDNFSHLVNTQKEFLENLCVNSDLSSAIDSLRRHIKAISSNQVPLEDLVLSKKLAKADYTNKPVTLYLTERMRQDPDRAPEAPEVGDRVHYIIVEDVDPTNKKRKQAAVTERGETLAYVRQKRLKPDAVYYMGCLQKAMGRVLTPLIGAQGTKNLFHTSKVGPLDNMFAKQLTKAETETKTETQKRHRSSSSDDCVKTKKARASETKKETGRGSDDHIGAKKAMTLMHFFSRKE